MWILKSFGKTDIFVSDLDKYIARLFILLCSDLKLIWFPPFSSALMSLFLVKIALDSVLYKYLVNTVEHLAAKESNKNISDRNL